jgi:hypothetical protein
MYLQVAFTSASSTLISTLARVPSLEDVLF